MIKNYCDSYYSYNMNLSNGVHQQIIISSLLLNYFLKTQVVPFFSILKILRLHFLQFKQFGEVYQILNFLRVLRVSSLLLNFIILFFHPLHVQNFFIRFNFFLFQSMLIFCNFLLNIFTKLIFFFKYFIISDLL